MARSRRRKSPRRRRRLRGDWVYRPDVVYGDNPDVSTGAWAPGIYTTVGDAPDESTALILYDSEDLTEVVSRLGAPVGLGLQGTLPKAARADTRRPTALMVQGGLLIFPAALTIGSRVNLKIRLGWWEQDTLTGLISIQLEYRLWGETNLGDNAVWSNNRVENIKTWTHIRAGSNTGVTDMYYLPIFWKGMARAPSSRHALALLIEGGPNSLSSTRFAPEVRAYMHDPNS